MTIRAVFWDVGDTLLHAWALKAQRFPWVCQQADIMLPDDPLLVQAGCRAYERFFQARHQHPDMWSDPWIHRLNRTGLEAAGVQGDLDAMAVRMHHAALEVPFAQVVDPEAPPLLQRLQENGFRLAVISNWDGTLLKQLRQCQLDRYFDEILDSAVVGVRKPDPSIFHMACRSLGVQPEEALHVGDTPADDVAGALAAGVRPVLLDPLDIFGDGFPGVPPVERIQRLSEFPALLKNHD